MDDYALYERDEPNLTGVERGLYDAISAEEPWALVEHFADLERVSGSADERRAADYIAERLNVHGIDYDRYEPEIWLSIPENASLSVTAPIEREYDAVKTVSFSKSGTASGPVVHVEPPVMNEGNRALNATFDHLDTDVDGRIVLVEANYLSREMIADLESHGATAIVGIQLHEIEPHEGIATPVWGAIPAPEAHDRVPDVIVTNVSKTVGDELRKFASDGLEATVRASAPRKWKTCSVVVAQIPGEVDPNEEDFVLLHGHYDSWHYGVTDNATGDGGLLELARVFDERSDELRRDLRVAWWPAHSTGRYGGSTWYATEFALDLTDHCIAQVNMDSPGAKDATEFEDMAGWMAEGEHLCKRAVDDVCGKKATADRLHRAGDASFNNLGVTGLFMLSSNIPKEVREARGYHPIGGSGGNSNAWHLSTDTLDKADPAVLVRDIRVYAVLVSRLLRAPVIPLDFSRTVETHQKHIDDYQAAAGDHFDLSGVRDDLDSLDDAFDALDIGTVDHADANEALRRVERRLVRVNYVSEGTFEQDPALNRPPYPSLAPVTELPSLEGDEYRFHRTTLERARNAVRHDLQTAREALASTL